MAKVIHLKKGERAPKGSNALTIEVISDRSQESIESGPNRMKIRVRASSFEATLADMQQKAKGSLMEFIYVKGARN